MLVCYNHRCWGVCWRRGKCSWFDFCCGVGILFRVILVVCIALFSDGSCLQHQKTTQYYEWVLVFPLAISERVHALCYISQGPKLILTKSELPKNQ